VIGGGVEPALSGRSRNRQRLTRAGRAVIDERAQRVSSTRPHVI
jgi:hypothetical protein